GPDFLHALLRFRRGRTFGLHAAVDLDRHCPRLQLLARERAFEVTGLRAKGLREHRVVGGDVDDAEGDAGLRAGGLYAAFHDEFGAEFTPDVADAFRGVAERQGRSARHDIERFHLAELPD